MTDFRFAEPQRVLWLWAVLAAVAALVWVEFRGSGMLHRFLSAEMAGRLVRRPSVARRVMRLIYLGLAGVAIILALMRPQWGIGYEKLPQVGAQIMVCLDVSRSMLAEDVAPNRLDRAKAEIVDLLNLLDGDQVGLIAFAGKSTVLCPLTTDFGFLKLILDEAGPSTVGRGGTRLEEPIRKAVAGFGEAADLSRVVLLITDGDDLDSYPIEAAKEAREKGVRILTVGFGDESGSKISVTNPKTGLKSFIEDQHGEPVVSRLNGELLREVALITEGAYIPAGTGSLDLVQIHETHIEPLLRAETEGTIERVENEGFQWALFAGLIFFLLSLGITIRSARPDATVSEQPSRRIVGSSAATKTAAVLVFVVAITALGECVRAQSADAVPGAVVDDPADTDDIVVGPPSEEQDGPGTAGTADLLPRELYNHALAKIPLDVDEAIANLETARSEAAADGELRYRAAFNLGWLAAEKGEQLIDSEPREALRELRLAIDWFQRAVRLRPKSDDARYNLEIVMRRAMALADALAEQDKGDLARRLDQLIEGQRNVLSEAAELLVRYEGSDRETLDGEDARREFRRLGVSQRQQLADAEAISESISNRLAAAEANPQAGGANPPASPDPWEPARLEAAQGHLTAANQRMSKARSMFRLREAHRGYRRAHLALEALKSARDQLREPGERLRLLLADSQFLVKQTDAVAKTEMPEDSAPPGGKPPWLDTELLAGTQQAILRRTGEIASQLQIPDDAAAGDDGPGLTEQQIKEARAAHAAMEKAVASFADALAELENQTAASALPYQLEAIARLNEAVEYLIELRGLIELTYRDASRLEQTLRQWDSIADKIDPEFVKEQLVALHDKNVQRAGRLADKLRDQLTRLDKPQPLGPEPIQPQGMPEPQSPEEEEQQREKQRLQRATELLSAAREQMQSVSDGLATTLDGKLAAEFADDEDTEATEADQPIPRDDVEPGVAELTLSAADAMVRQLAELRRLFYTIAEHLKETAQQQANVNDETQAIAGEPDEERRSSRLGPLQNRQEETLQKSQTIADELQKLAQTSPSDGPSASVTPPKGLQPNQSPPQPSPSPIEQYGEAAELVRDAVQEMQDASQLMEAADLEIAEIRQPQDAALAKLQEALALLQPPQDQQNQDESQQNQQQEQQDGQQGEQPQLQQGMNAQQLLQLIRDREAERRKQKKSRSAPRRERVEKDW